jgi:hypothetical protein
VSWRWRCNAVAAAWFCAFVVGGKGRPKIVVAAADQETGGG